MKVLWPEAEEAWRPARGLNRLWSLTHLILEMQDQQVSLEQEQSQIWSMESSWHTPVQPPRLGIDWEHVSCCVSTALPLASVAAAVVCFGGDSDPWLWAEDQVNRLHHGITFEQNNALTFRGTTTPKDYFIKVQIVIKAKEIQPECMGLGWPLRDLWFLLLRLRLPPAITRAGDAMHWGGDFPICLYRAAISSFWRVCKAWISFMCL